MSVFEPDTPDELWNFVPGTERSGPVRNRKASVVTGDQSAGNNQEEGPACEESREPMMPTVISCRNRFQKVPLGSMGSRGRADRTVKSDPAPLTRYVNNPMLTTQNGYSAAALKLWSTVFESFGATVTFWSCSPSFSWTKAIV